MSFILRLDSLLNGSCFVDSYRFSKTSKTDVVYIRFNGWLALSGVAIGAVYWAEVEWLFSSQSCRAVRFDLRLGDCANYFCWLVNDSSLYLSF